VIDLLRQLDSRGLAPDTLAVRDPSLDDVFLSLTGRVAESEPAQEAAGRRGRAR
jgi:ABC-2 type transport system ATP-binding protein